MCIQTGVHPAEEWSRKSFYRPEVAAFYNEHFICFRLDAEKGEGPALAKKYGVSAYPTWLYLEADGMLRSRKTDFLTGAEFIKLGSTVLGNNATYAQLSALETQFSKGDRSADFLRSYLELRTAAQLDNAAVMDAYLYALGPNKAGPELIRFLIKNAGRTWSAAIPYIAQHLVSLDNAAQKQLPGEFFDEHLYFAWGDAVKEKDTVTAVRAMAAAEKVYPLLDEAKQLTWNRSALYHCKNLQLKAGLKTAGYRLAKVQMAIDTAYARQQDKILLDQVMAPFRSRKQDSTKIPGFAEEKKLAATQYSGKTASILYETALAFADVLPTDDPALTDARKWAERAVLLVPNEHTRALFHRLRDRR
ncbi:hypothetical protein [Sphingobacterium sp. UBA1498]|uniref:hypothetical protein n=1 Tax=Sphingobacterium sp. UBA1498 TaxID=1947481 RepID=UPI0025D508CB|nr:hypothetical protein [Sphingobacterium sp. UBA1498]